MTTDALAQAASGDVAATEACKAAPVAAPSPDFALPGGHCRKLLFEAGETCVAGAGGALGVWAEPEAEPSGSSSSLGQCTGSAVLRVAGAAYGGHDDDGSDTDVFDAREMLRSAQVVHAPGNGGGNMRMTVKLGEAELIRWSELQLIRPVSTGSFGEVFLSSYRGEYVSVKRCILRADGSMTPEQLLNLEREINTYKALNHPAIVRYVGCVLEHPNLAVVTEYLENGNVFDLLYMRRVNLPAAIRLKIARTVSEAIAYMHSCDPIVIHRDLKTQNMVLDINYDVKLCDFGKTQALWADCLPSDQDNGGSPRYMAPECFVPGGAITEKVDIWSLGCCLVEVFGGPLPYEDMPSMQQVLHYMLHERHGPLVPPWFSPVVTSTLTSSFAFEPSERIDIAEVLRALKRLTSDEMERCRMDIRRSS